MEPRDKAKEILKKYYGITDVNWGMHKQKQCSLIAIEVIIKELKMRNCSVKYWNEVKEEIEKL